jgi:hypothetical protein
MGTKVARSVGLEPTTSASPPEADSIRVLLRQAREQCVQHAAAGSGLQEAFSCEGHALAVEGLPMEQSPRPVGARPAAKARIVLGKAHFRRAACAADVAASFPVRQDICVPGHL